jgi:threonine dehydratase
VTYADVEAAAERLVGVANRTPVLLSQTAEDRTGCRAFFKCEPFQRAGAFKFRGAYNTLLKLRDAGHRGGVLTWSSGNHAQAVALAARILGIRATVVMPEDAPAVKLAATRDYGAEIILYDKRLTTREALGRQIAEDRNLPIIPPFDHPDIVAGQGTAAKELFEEVGPLDFLLVPVGGGGLISGCALAARALSPECRVIGVEPERADDATRSFRTRTLQSVQNPDTIADGARTASLGQVTFPLVLDYVSDMVTVSEAAIVRAMHFLWERMKIVVEPTGALAAAALLEGVVPSIRDRPGARAGVVLSGGNVDLRDACHLFGQVEADE